jgi:hypothetical protein
MGKAVRSLPIAIALFDIRTPVLVDRILVQSIKNGAVTLEKVKQTELNG